MNDTHKLLLAFIEASGFDIELVCETKEWFKPCDVDNSGNVNPLAQSVGSINNNHYKVTKK